MSISGPYIGSVTRERDKAWTVTLQNSAGAAFDTTADGGWTAEAQMRDAIDGPTLVLTWTVTVSGASNNILTLSATAAQLAEIAPGCYFTDIRLLNQTDSRVEEPNLAASGAPKSHIVQINVRGRVTR